MNQKKLISKFKSLSTTKALTKSEMNKIRGGGVKLPSCNGRACAMMCSESNPKGKEQ